jgi:hypothetical protein
MKKLTNNALAYAINCFLNTDCWTAEQVKVWRDQLDSGSCPGIQSNPGVRSLCGTEDTPVILGDEYSDVGFQQFLSGFDGQNFVFDDISLLSVFCSAFIGAGVDRVDGFIMIYQAEDHSAKTILQDESWLQKVEFRIGGAEEYNAFEDMVNTLWNIYGDWGWCPNVHIEINNVLGTDDWFYQN